MANVIKAAVINDIHFGITDSQRLFNELHQFTDFVKENDIQLVVIDGDYFDRKLSLTDVATYLAVQFFDSLYNLCKEKQIKLRMVQGTRSHELNQLQIFEAHESDPNIDFRIIKTVCEEDILGMHVLYIPEEYPENEEEYYKEFKGEDKRYNVIFGHGTWDFVSFDNQIQHAKQTATRSAPVFIWQEWKHTVPNGFITFGHIHGRNVYGKKIYYSGAFSRWGYGERSARGFTYFEYDLEKLTYDVKFIDNTEAPTYDEITVASLDIDMENQDIKKIQSALDEQLGIYDNLAIDMSGLSDENISILRKIYAHNPKVKLEVKTKKEIITESTGLDAEVINKYRYITKRTLPLNEMIQKFCKEDLGQDIPQETIDKILKEGD